MRYEGWKEVARYLGKHPDTVKRWFRRGKILLTRNPANNRVVLYTDDLKKSENTYKMP